jgi:hypothetical protein
LSSSRRRVRGSPRGIPPPAIIQPALTLDSEDSSNFSSTAGAINQGRNSMNDETSGSISRTSGDVSVFARRLMNAVPTDEDKNKSSSPLQVPPSKSTASVTRARVRKAEEQATIISSSTFPSMSPANNNYNALNMFSYSPNKGNTTIQKIDNTYNNSNHDQQRGSLLPIKLRSSSSSLDQEARSMDFDHQPSHHHSHNLIHRIPLRDHSAVAATTDRDRDQPLRLANTFVSEQSEGAESTHKILVTRSYEVKEHMMESIFYVSTSAILVSIVRTYLARIFGMDCEMSTVNDFLAVVTSNICVTNGGQTWQTGGALFYDFPANVLGSFILGFITPTNQRSRFPWLHRDHPLQRDDVLHASLGMGFCGR